MRTSKRIYRTLEGEFVLEGHPDAAVLAYGAADEVENRDADAVKALLEPETKKSPAPQNKKAPAPRNK